MNNRIHDILFLSLRAALFGAENNEEFFASLSEEEWRMLFRTSKHQGILAIVYDVVSKLPKELQPPRNIKLQWALSVEGVENRYTLQRKTSAFLAELWAESGIQTIVMKGLAIGTYYPNPAHRECGDLDCFLTTGSIPITCDGYEQGNQIAERLGAKVNRDYYKDAAIRYRGLMVENHSFFLPIRGSRRMKCLEHHLRKVVLRGKISHVSGTKLIVPSPDFNALFLSMHGFNHFISEGIRLRHILDWALLLKTEQNNIDWEEFYHWADKMHLTRFVDALTTISVERLGLQITVPAIHSSSPYAERILHDTLYESEGLFNKDYSAWKSRFILVKSKIAFGWKYHEIYQKSILVELIKSIFAFIFERNPKL